MQVKLTGSQQNVSKNEFIGKVNPRELNERTFYYYCTLYLTEKIYRVIPSTSNITYGVVAKLISAIDPELFDNLHLETNKIILLNQIYSAFMMASEEELSREFLYNLMVHIASYDPAQFENEEEVRNESNNAQYKNTGFGTHIYRC